MFGVRSGKVGVICEMGRFQKVPIEGRGAGNANTY